MDFVFSEFSSLSFGDARLDRRLRLQLENMLKHPSASVQSSCNGWAETMGAYRLFNNPKVNSAAILEPHREGLLSRAQLHSCIALIQDTTELDYSTHAAMPGRGSLNSETRRGFYLHSQYAVSDTRVPLGVWHTHLWAREQVKGDYDPSLPIEQKESYRWVEGMRQAHALAQRLPDKEVFSVCDREGDIYEVLQECSQLGSENGAHAHLLVRANYDRCVQALHGERADEPSNSHLFEVSKQAKALGCLSFKLPSRRGVKKVKGSSRTYHRKARNVRQQLKVCELTLSPPSRHRKGVKMHPCKMWLVIAEEIDAPEGEEPLRWMLLTSYRVANFEQAQKIVNLYMARWDIEVFHRILKTGCKVEHLRFEERSAFEPALMCNMIVAWRLQYLVQIARVCPDLPCSSVFAEEEWRAAVTIDRKVSDPSKLIEPTIGEMVKIISRFGGHLGRNSDAPPGAQCIWTGLARIRDFAIAIAVYQQRR